MSVGVLQDNLVLSTELIMQIGHRKEIQKLTFQSSALRRSDWLTLETPTFESLYSGQFTLSTQLIKPNYRVFFTLRGVQFNAPFYNAQGNADGEWRSVIELFHIHPHFLPPIQFHNTKYLLQQGKSLWWWWGGGGEGWSVRENLIQALETWVYS